MKGKIFVYFLMFVFSLAYGQENKAVQKLHNEPKLLEKIHLLDLYMQNNDFRILETLADDVSFGHSNGWTQNYEDFKKDFTAKKVVYNSIEEIEILEFKEYKNTASIRRKIKVSGIYKVYDFKMTLSLLEIWIKKGKEWKLWSRQATELKQ